MSRLKHWRRSFWHLRHGGVRQWRAHRSRQRAATASPDTSLARTDADGRLIFPPYPRPQRSPARPGLRVGVILDEFSLQAFSYEWDQVVLTPRDWRKQVADRPIDLLFVESAWHGNNDAWQYHLTGPSAPRPALIELVQWCRDHGIPTVFWNKEDPAHFEDFLDCARLFDQVFTTDSRKVSDYRRALGHERVGTMMFAAQPAIHNPVRTRTGYRERDVAFAGMYFAHKYPERREQMAMLLGGAARVSARMKYGLEIFSRYLGGDERYQFPPPLGERVVGSLDYPRMLTAYRAYKVFLNVNSVIDSPSMCARRIFEITASGAAVVSTPSPAIDVVFPDREIAQVSEEKEVEFTIRALVRNDGVRDRLVHRAQRRIWREHTYSHRVDHVLDASGLREHNQASRNRKVTALVSTNRPQHLHHVLRTLGAQVGVELQVALLTHGFEISVQHVRRLADDVGLDEVTVLSADADVPLGECLNRLVEVADGDALAKIDDDDHYGPHYLADAVHSLGYSGADLVGKQAHYLYLGGADVTVLRMPEREHTYTDRVMGPSMLFTADLASAVRFEPVPRGEDTAFLAATVAERGTIYSADRFNFLQVRNSDPAVHTWAVSDIELMAGGEVEIHGQFPEQVMN